MTERLDQIRKREAARVGPDVFETRCDIVDVTSRHRPDTNWHVVDAHGHDHRWYVDGARYKTPTLVWVKDGEEYWEGDDEPHDVGHLECRQCGEPIEPGYTADTTQQHIAGLTRCAINGEPVTPEEFQRRLRAAKDL